MARSFTRRRRFPTRKIRFNAVFPQCPEVCKAFQSASRLKKTSACDGETFKGGRKDAPLKRRGNGMRRLPARSRQYFFRRADLKIFKFTAAAASRQAKESYGASFIAPKLFNLYRREITSDGIFRLVKNVLWGNFCAEGKRNAKRRSLDERTGFDAAENIVWKAPGRVRRIAGGLERGDGRKHKGESFKKRRAKGRGYRAFALEESISRRFSGEIV